MERRAVEEALSAKGFALREKPGDDHRYYRLIVAGKSSEILTKVSTGNKYRDLGDDLVQLMARQTKLTQKDFRALVQCKIDGPGYLDLLRKQGVRL